MGRPDRTAAGLSARGRRLRLLATAGLLGMLAFGSVAGHDGLFPVGPMVQYAFYVSPNGTISSIEVEADTSAHTHVVVPLSPRGVGIRRASVEGQVPAIERDPRLLRPIAVGQRRLHPDEPQYVRLYLVENTTVLRRGTVVGHGHRVIVAWEVR